MLQGGVVHSVRCFGYSTPRPPPAAFSPWTRRSCQSRRRVDQRVRAVGPCCKQNRSRVPSQAQMPRAQAEARVPRNPQVVGTFFETRGARREWLPGAPSTAEGANVEFLVFQSYVRLHGTVHVRRTDDCVSILRCGFSVVGGLRQRALCVALGQRGRRRDRAGLFFSRSFCRWIVFSTMFGRAVAIQRHDGKEVGGKKFGSKFYSSAAERS